MAAKSPQDQKKERLAAALRANLKRRKQQARARVPTDAPPASAEADADHSQDGVEQSGLSNRKD
jgi:hypothetical protein